MKNTKVIVLAAFVGIAPMSALAADEENAKFTTSIDQTLEQEGERDFADLQQTAINDTISRYEGGVLDGETHGSDYQSNIGTGNSAAGLQNDALAMAQSAQSTANTADWYARDARSRAISNRNEINSLGMDVSTPRYISKSGTNWSGKPWLISASAISSNGSTGVKIYACGKLVVRSLDSASGSWSGTSSTGIVPSGCSYRVEPQSGWAYPNSDFRVTRFVMRVN